MSNRHGLIRDIGIRMSGLVLGAIGAGAMVVLYRLVNAPPRHEASPIELLIGIAGFMSASAGVTLLALGAHIFDQIEISARWVSRPVQPPRLDRHPQPPQRGGIPPLGRGAMQMSLTGNSR